MSIQSEYLLLAEKEREAGYGAISAYELTEDELQEVRHATRHWPIIALAIGVAGAVMLLGPFVFIAR